MKEGVEVLIDLSESGVNGLRSRESENQQQPHMFKTPDSPIEIPVSHCEEIGVHFSGCARNSAELPDSAPRKFLLGAASCCMERVRSHGRSSRLFDIVRTEAL